MKNFNQTKSKRSQLRITVWNCPISTREWISFNLNFPNSAVSTKCNMAETWLFQKRAKKNGFKFSIRGGGFHWVVSAYGFFNRSFVVIYDSASIQINHRQWEKISFDYLVGSHVLDTVSCLMRADFQVARMACQTQTGGSACGFCLGFHYVFGFWGWSVFDGIWAIPSCKTSIKLLTEERNGMIPIVDEEIAETQEYGGGEAISSSGYL